MSTRNEGALDLSDLSTQDAATLRAHRAELTRQKSNRAAVEAKATARIIRGVEEIAEAMRALAEDASDHDARLRADEIAARAFASARPAGGYGRLAFLIGDSSRFT